jgi:HSP20 family protein
MIFTKTNNGFTPSFNTILNDLLYELPNNLGKTFSDNVLNYPPVNINETKDAYHLEVATPGWEKSDFKIKLEGNILTLSASLATTEKEETVKQIRKEFKTKSFKRSFTLDEKIEAKTISAKYDNGILQIVLPKKEEIKVAEQEIVIL